jgi:hypothetical protein
MWRAPVRQTARDRATDNVEPPFAKPEPDSQNQTSQNRPEPDNKPEPDRHLGSRKTKGKKPDRHYLDQGAAKVEEISRAGEAPKIETGRTERSWPRPRASLTLRMRGDNFPRVTLTISGLGRGSSQNADQRSQRLPARDGQLSGKEITRGETDHHSARSPRRMDPSQSRSQQWHSHRRGSTCKGRSAPADTSKPAAPGVRRGLRDRCCPAQRPRKPAIEARDRRRPLLDDDPQTLQYRSKMVGDLTSTTTNLASGPVQQFQILLDRQR